MSKKKIGEMPEIAKGIKDMLASATTFDERAKSVEIAMKFEALKHKFKGNEYGKGFDDEGGEDDNF